MIVEIDGIPIEVIPKRIKSINIRVYPPDGLVKMTVPLRFKEQHIRSHLTDKLGWIIKQKKRIQEISQSKTIFFQTGSTILFQGNSYLLLVEEHHGPSHIKIIDQVMHCYTRNTSSAHVEAQINNWYRREMESLIPQLILQWQTIIGVHVNEWGIKKMITRWGSCNPHRGRIWLNLNLMQKPKICLEYVLVHELIHLLEASHNQRFYTLMKKYMPAWKDYHFLLEGKLSRIPETMSF